MRLIKQMIIGLLLVLVSLQGSYITASAEQVNSVKDCLEDQSKCSEEQLQKKADPKAEQGDETSTVGLTFWDFLKMIFATLFVIGLLYIILKYLNKRSRSFNNNQLLLNLGGTAVGTNRSVQLVKIGKTVMVLGVGESVQLLKEITNEDEAKEIIEEYNRKMDVLVQPNDIVTKIIDRAKNLKEKKIVEQPFSSILKSQLEDFSKGRKKLFEEIDKKKGPDKDE